MTPRAGGGDGALGQAFKNNKKESEMDYPSKDRGCLDLLVGIIVIVGIALGIIICICGPAISTWLVSMGIGG